MGSRSRALPPMQHATCNMRLCRQRCELNGCCGDGVVGSGRAPTTSPRICMAWWEGYRTLFQGTGPDPRASSELRGGILRFPAPCTCLHLHPHLHLHLYSWSVSQGGWAALDVWAGEWEGTTGAVMISQSVNVGKMWACLSKLAVQKRASHSCIKAPPESLVLDRAAFSSGIPSFFYSVPPFSNLT